MNWLISIFIFAIGFSCECARAACLSSMEHNRSTLIFQFVYGSEWLCEWVRLRVSRIRLKQHWLWVWHWSVFITRIPPSRIFFFSATLFRLLCAWIDFLLMQIPCSTKVSFHSACNELASARHNIHSSQSVACRPLPCVRDISKSHKLCLLASARESQLNQFVWNFVFVVRRSSTGFMSSAMNAIFSLHAW